MILKTLRRLWDLPLITLFLFWLVVMAGYGIGVSAVMAPPDWRWWQVFVVAIAFQGSVSQAGGWVTERWRATAPKSSEESSARG